MLCSCYVHVSGTTVLRTCPMAILYNRSTLSSLTLSSTISPSSLVTFSDEATASAAQGAYNGQDFQGRNLIVHEDRGATKGSKTASTEVDPNFTGTSVFVNNLSWATTDDELKAYFNQFGSVSAKIALRKDGKSRGWGTVQFSDPEQAMQAVENMKGSDFGGRTIECLIDKKA